MNELFGAEAVRQSMFWIAAAACAVAETAIIFSSIRSVQKAGGTHAVRETMWAILPALALMWLLSATWTEVRRADAHQHMKMPMSMPGSSS